MGDLMHAASDLTRLFSYLYTLVQHFTVMHISSVLTMERGEQHPLEGQISALSDAIVRLAVETDESRTRRTVRIIKARGIDHDLEKRELRITAQGVQIG